MQVPGPGAEPKIRSRSAKYETSAAQQRQTAPGDLPSAEDEEDAQLLGPCGPAPTWYLISPLPRQEALRLSMIES